MTTRTVLTVGSYQYQLEASNAGVGIGRRRVGELDGETVYGSWQRRAVGVRDHGTLAEYRAAVVQILTLVLSQQEATDAYWQRITQVQWDNR